MTMFEGICPKCGETTFQDEYRMTARYGWKIPFDRTCASECGGYVDTWKLSDEPHPSVWA